MNAKNQFVQKKKEKKITLWNETMNEIFILKFIEWRKSETKQKKESIGYERAIEQARKKRKTKQGEEEKH